MNAFGQIALDLVPNGLQYRVHRPRHFAKHGLRIEDLAKVLIVRFRGACHVHAIGHPSHLQLHGDVLRPGWILGIAGRLAQQDDARVQRQAADLVALHRWRVDQHLGLIASSHRSPPRVHTRRIGPVRQQTAAGIVRQLVDQILLFAGTGGQIEWCRRRQIQCVQMGVVRPGAGLRKRLNQIQVAQCHLGQIRRTVVDDLDAIRQPVAGPRLDPLVPTFQAGALDAFDHAQQGIRLTGLGFGWFPADDVDLVVGASTA